ncbi:MAG: ABC transporter ATP-binding protein [Methanomassiliicoccales archaeon]|nr:ABC transporter ATP-binding protein [Methanomassiliicoccales archaeon]
MRKPILVSVNGVSKEYGSGVSLVKALRDVDLELLRGDIVVFLGPSGSGKTTLLNIVGGIENVTRGEVVVDDQRIDLLDSKALTDYRRNKVGFIFQFFNLIPSLTALENVEIAARLSDKSMSSREALKRVGLGERVDHFPSQLSGGEQQRVAIARAVVRKPVILLADEPTGELDENNGRRVLALLQDMNREFGMTVLLVTHNSAIANMSNRVVRMHSGSIASVEENASPIEATEVRW